jgi:hypothetical protein
MACDMTNRGAGRYDTAGSGSVSDDSGDGKDG